MKESKFQKQVIDEISEMFPDSEVIKNDPTYKQGFPDLTVFVNNRFACLECKKSKNEPHRPNQDYYVDKLNKMSFARFIYPENKEDVLNELYKALQP